MRSLWFKQRYVDAILTGEKHDTIRAKSPARLRIGEIVAASVGPVRPFARLEIVAMFPVAVEALDADTRNALHDIYPEIISACRITFRVVERITPEQPAG